MYLKNCWYVAELGHALGRALKPVAILGERVVLYRREDGSAVALEDACPHRKLPLSMGRLKGDRVECGYHGLTFDGAGICTRVPGAERIPHVARVRAFPVADRYGFVWIWMGDPALADADAIFEVEHYDDPAWGRNTPDSMELACNYLYMTDNLLDPSHVAWVHQTSFASAGTEETPLETTIADGGVTVWRWMRDVEPAPFYTPFLTFAGTCDRKQHYEVRYPSNALARAIFTPAGQSGADQPLPEKAFVMDSYNFLTPVDEGRTRYFWIQLLNAPLEGEDTIARFSKGVRGVFEEDQVVLEAVQKGMAEKRTPNLDLRIDAGPLRFRRGLARLIAAETPSSAIAAE